MSTLKKYYSILELRTALTAGLSAFSGGAFGFYLTGELNVTLFLLMVACAYVINLIANVANEIHGYLTREDNIIDDTHSGTNGLTRGVITLKESFFVLFLAV